MMGYAERPADLARGPELTELRTGDLARQADDGLWEIVGRLGRQTKLFGLRLDLDRVERLLLERGRPARVLVHDDRLWVFTSRPRSVERTRRAVLEATGLPTSAVRVVHLDKLPQTSSGKPDYAALAQHAGRIAADDAVAPGAATADGIRDLYAVLLGRPDATVHDSFVDLGGDSLSYVEASTRLGQALGTLPQGWQRLDPEALAGSRRKPRRFTVPTDLSALLRAVAVLLILVSHADIAQLQGGAHVLLAVAGYNLARFQLALPAGPRGSAASCAPRSPWGCRPRCGSRSSPWRPVTTAGRRRSSSTGSPAPTGGATTGSSGSSKRSSGATSASPHWSPYRGSTGGRAVRRSQSRSQCSPSAWSSATRWWASRRARPSATKQWCCCGAWPSGGRRPPPTRPCAGWSWPSPPWCPSPASSATPSVRPSSLVGVLLLLLDRAVPLPRLVAGAVQVVAAASLWIYLTQWQVYPGLEDAGHPYAAVLAALAVGILAHLAWLRAGRLLRRKTQPGWPPGRVPDAAL